MVGVEWQVANGKRQIVGSGWWAAGNRRLLAGDKRHPLAVRGSWQTAIGGSMVGGEWQATDNTPHVVDGGGIQ